MKTILFLLGCVLVLNGHAVLGITAFFFSHITVRVKHVAVDKSVDRSS